MAKSGKQMEGNEQQRRAAARRARDAGLRPSEAGATLGASKQRKKASTDASHPERLQQRDHGKQRGATRNTPRPGARNDD